MGFRRVVTGHDAGGKAVIIMDGEATKVRQPTDEITSTLLWSTDETPARNDGNKDMAERDIGIAPPPSGSIFRIVEFFPEKDESGGDLDYMDAAGAQRPDGARHAGMHKTDSIDYAIIMSGEIDMLMDDTEVHLKAGDIIIQRGTNHAWSNRGTEPCAIAFILIDGEKAP